MRKVRNDEKIIGPMFPRLHVNDTEKGGPRAPPRNKMALYEHFSIPSQRQNPSKATDLVHPASSSRGTTGHEKSCSGYSEFSLSSTQQPQKNQNREEDDYAVPVFVQSMKGQDPCIKHTSSNPRSKPVIPVVVDKGNSKVSVRNTNGEWNQVRRLQPSDVLQKESRVYSNASDEFISCMDNGYNSAPRIDLSSREQGHMDEISENTIVDSVSVLDVSPDDVVAMIGQKCFWKARKQLLNQQRLFAVQVFELHRLIKVQKLIAESPHFLLQDDINPENPSENLPQDPKKPKEDAIKLLEKSKRLSEENKIVKTNPIQHVQVSKTAPQKSHGSNHQPWPQHYQQQQQPRNHWLVPIMSPSEGLVYKPFPVPGFISPGPHHPYPLGYFPQYGNHYPPSGAHASALMPENSYPMSGAHAVSRGSELLQQVSTASSPYVQASEEGRTGNLNALPLFPTRSVSNNSDNNPSASRVIKVVPRNARTASESVARIFQSIQEGRK